MPTIENLDIQITASASDAASKIGRLASALSGVRGPSNSAKNGLKATKDETVQAGSKFQRLSNDVVSANKSLVNFSKEVQNAGKAAKRGESGVSKFISSIKRIVLYRAIRSIIREISDAFREGTTNVYEWSKTVGGEFASNVDTLKSSIDLLKNSLGTLAVPLLNSLAPALNAIIDKLVDMINAFNMALAALNGQSTYTVAVRGASSTSNALTQMAEDAQNAEKAIKETVLGFDEINKLSSESTGGGSGGSGGGSGSGTTGFHFEERELEGFWAKVSDITSKMPDWLKWLLTGTALVGGFALIKSFIPWLIDKIKDLFSLTIPDFLKWLFGGGDDGGGDIERDVKIDLEKGDWSALDGLSPQKVELDPSWSGSASEMFKDFKGDWDDLGSKSLYFVPKMNNSAKVLYDDFMKDWDALGSKSLYFSPKLDNTAKSLYDGFKRDWDALGSKSLYFSPKFDNQAQVLYNGFKKEWDSASRILGFNPGWTSATPVADMYNNFIKSWNSTAKYLRFNPGWTSATPVRDMYENFVKSWNGTEKRLKFNPGWTSTTPVRDMYENFKKSWNASAKFLKFNPGWTSSTPVRDMYENFVKSWSSAAKWLKFNPGWTSTTPVRDMYENFVKSWNSSAKKLKFNPGWTSSTPVADMYNNFKKSWNTQARLLNFNAKWAGDNPVSDFYNNFKKTWNAAARTLGFNAKWSGDNPVSDFYNNFKKSWNKSERKLEFNAKLSKTANDIWNSFKADWDSKTRKVTATVEFTSQNSTGFGGATGGGGGTSGGGDSHGRRANGGIITPFGISDFANGGILGHGTLFRAGENGAEVVGHIGGRTEVLNRSQLASTMYYSVRSAMAPLYTYGNSDESMTALAEYIGNAIDSAMAKDRELMRQQNEYLRQINDKEFSAEITTSSINQAQTRMNRRAGTTIVPVGT